MRLLVTAVTDDDDDENQGDNTNNSNTNSGNHYPQYQIYRKVGGPNCRSRRFEEHLVTTPK